MRVALVHDWSNGRRGGETVLEQSCVMCPDTVIYAPVCMSKRLSEAVRRMKVHAAFVRRTLFWEPKCCPVLLGLLKAHVAEMPVPRPGLPFRLFVFLPICAAITALVLFLRWRGRRAGL